MGRDDDDASEVVHCELSKAESEKADKLEKAKIQAKQLKDRFKFPKHDDESLIIYEDQRNDIQIFNNIIRVINKQLTAE